MNYDLSSRWYERFSNRPVMIRDLMEMIDSDPVAAWLFHSEIPNLKTDKIYLSRWLSAIEGQIVETYSGRRKLVHLGRHWALVEFAGQTDESHPQPKEENQYYLYTGASIPTPAE